MTHPPTARSPTIAVLAVLAALVAAFMLPVDVGVLHVVRSLALWLLFMVVPGACLFRLIDRGERSAGELVLAGVIASPVVTTVVSIAARLSGVDSGLASGFVATALLAWVVFVRRPALVLPVRREAVVLTVFTVGLLLLTSTLPFAHEWWRIRSDAWFHAAVVAQIRDFGLPPEDPYFVGMPLQYMWFYHVLLLTLSTSLRVDPFWCMALVNAHAVVALVLAGFYFAGTLRTSFRERFAGMATLVLAFNAAFWILLPVKLVKAFMGDVRGMDEIARTFALTPLHYDTAYGFMNIYFNQEFFLDKFMVATAFGTALVFMAAGWGGAIDYLQTGRRFGLAILVVSLFGMLGFHSLVGFVFLVGLVGGCTALHMFRARVDGYRPRAALLLVATGVICFLAMTPYLYQVMHAKESEQVFPIDFSFKKIAGILISSAFVMFVALRARVFSRDRSVGMRFLAFGTAAVTVFCFSIALPGPNTYDKLGYFVFIPFSVVAGFAIADSIASAPARRRRAVTAAWVLLFYVPVNAIAFVSCFATPSRVEVTPAELRLSEWVRANTARDAVFIDDQDRVPLLVTGPRRYYWGTLAYAEQWGYPKPEMSRRRHVVDALYRDADIDGAARDALAAIELPVYVVVRPEHAGRAVTRHPEWFVPVYDDPEISLMLVTIAKD